MTLPSEKNFVSEPVLFAYDISVIISSRNVWNFYTYSNSHIIKWFAANKLFIKLDKANIMKFIMNNSPHSSLSIGYERSIQKRWNIENYLVYKLITT